MGVLLVLGAWCAGSAVVSLALGAVVARADRRQAADPALREPVTTPARLLVDLS